MFRKDACGAWIVWDKFGVQDNLFGWKIDHVCPKSRLQQRGFSDEEIDDLRNLRSMQHQNNVSKADDYPSYTGVVTAEGHKNVYKEQNLTVNSILRKILSELYSR